MYEEEFVIFNPTLGVHDLVYLGEILTENDKTTAYLDEPYEMVGPFCLDQLLSKGQISFAECIVISTEKWKNERVSLLKKAYAKQQRLQEEHLKEIRRFNQQKHYNDKEDRKLLCLPLEGVLKVSQIKTAYRKVSKKVHPDLGGSHEEFLRLTLARDTLLKKFVL
jgi:hypothetical protein